MYNQLLSKRFTISRLDTCRWSDLGNNDFIQSYCNNPLLNLNKLLKQGKDLNVHRMFGVKYNLKKKL